MSRPKLFMLVGVPCAGKSTWVNHQIEDPQVALLTHIASTDNIIEGIAELQGKTYDEIFKDNIKNAEKQMYKNVTSAVDAEMDIIWDQTNITRRSRAKKLAMIPDHYEKIGVFFPTPSDLDERLASRSGKTIPPYVLDGMVEMLEQPMIEEGFDEVRVA